MSDITDYFPLLIFAVVVVGISMPILYQLFKWLVSRRLKLDVDKKELTRDETIRLDIVVNGGFRKIEYGIIAKEMYETSGKHGRLYEEKVLELKKEMQYGGVGNLTQEFQIPSSAPPSIGIYSGDSVRRVGLRYIAYAKVEVPLSPDYCKEIEIKVK